MIHCRSSQQRQSGDSYLRESGLTKAQARAACRYLKRGVCPPNAAEFFTVGLDCEIKSISSDLAAIRKGDTTGASRFLEAPYGYGKSHILRVIECMALAQGFAVTKVTHDGYDYAFNHPQRYLHHLCQNLSVPGLSITGLGNLITHLVRGQQKELVVRWAQTSFERAGIGHHILAMANATDRADYAYHRSVIDAHDIKHRSGTYNYHLLYERLAMMASFCCAIGLSGLVVLFDELESVATLLRNVLSRLRAYEILNRLTDISSFPSCYFCFAIVPDFTRKINDFDHGYAHRYYRSSHPIACTFMDTWVSSGVNLIHIPRIDKVDNRELCYRLRAVHQQAYSWRADDKISLEFIDSFVDEADRQSFIQREIVTSFVGVLDTCQQHPRFDPLQELSLSIRGLPSSTPGLTQGEDKGTVIDEALHKLTARQRRVLSLRFGLEGGTAHTLEEIAREIGVTRERIRQIVNDALSELTDTVDISALKSLMDSGRLVGSRYENILKVVLGEETHRSIFT